MMVEQSPYTDNIGLFIRDLDQVTKKLEEINQKPQIFSNHELNDLIQVLNRFNSAAKDPAFWEHKKFVQEGVNEKIEKALGAILLFRQHPQHDLSGKRNVDQAIASIFSTLNAELSAFDKNLRGLKEYKIGRRVEKTGETKHS